MDNTNYCKLIIAIAAAESAGVLGTAFMISSVPTWYVGLSQPALSPPAWIFAPVWVVLYLLMGIAAYLIWRKGLLDGEIKSALGIFLVQLILNALWPVVFFGLQETFAALIIILLLWVGIVATMVSFGRISRSASCLLLPYLLWVTFAIYLNAGIWLLNT